MYQGACVNSSITICCKYDISFPLKWWIDCVNCIIILTVHVNKNGFDDKDIFCGIDRHYFLQVRKFSFMSWIWKLISWDYYVNANFFSYIMICVRHSFCLFHIRHKLTMEHLYHNTTVNILVLYRYCRIFSNFSST